jgi:hypothetical protein
MNCSVLLAGKWPYLMKVSFCRRFFYIDFPCETNYLTFWEKDFKIYVTTCSVCKALLRSQENYQTDKSEANILNTNCSLQEPTAAFFVVSFVPGCGKCSWRWIFFIWLSFVVCPLCSKGYGTMSRYIIMLRRRTEILLFTCSNAGDQ